MIISTLEEMIIHKDWISSLMKSTDYNPKLNELVVEFNNGKKYLYKNFNLEEYRSFILSESQGKYFLTNIRGKYKDTDDVIKINIDEPSTGS